MTEKENDHIRQQQNQKEVRTLREASEGLVSKVKTAVEEVAVELVQTLVLRKSLLFLPFGQSISAAGRAQE